jgi:hypothetical protein
MTEEVPRTSTDAKDTHVEMLQKEFLRVQCCCLGHTDDMLISVVVSVVTFVLWSVMICQLVRSSYWEEKFKN